MHRLILLLVLLISAATPALSQTCDLYVNASDGDDGNAGTLTQPLRSFESAYRLAASGAEVCVAAGEYFQGADIDGIRLDESGKSVSFVINSFAGAGEVRFSEEYFLIASGSGAISFRAGSASRIVFGDGIVNTDTPAAPELLNFLHSLIFQSGTVQFTGLTVVIESPVGIPGRANPANSSKVAPDSARVAFRGVSLTGNIGYLSAGRTIEIGAGAYRIPSDLSDNTLVFAGGPSSVGAITLPRGRLRFEDNANVTFTGIVQIDGSDQPLQGAGSFSGSAIFEDELSITGAFAPAGGIINRGTGTIDLAQLSYGSAASAILGVSRIENSGHGVIALRRLVDGRAWAPDLININGRIVLGIQTALLDLPGSISNTDEVRLEGPVILRGVTNLPVALNNTGTIDLGGRDLTVTGTGNQFISSGSISGDGRLLLSDGSISGGGSLPSVVSDGSSSLTAGTLTQLQVLSGTTSLQGAAPQVTGALEIAAGASLDLAVTSFTINGRTSLDGALVSSVNPSLTLLGEVSGTGSLTGIGEVLLGGQSRQTVSGSISWPTLTLSGIGTDFGSPLSVSGLLKVIQGTHGLSASTTVGDLRIESGQLTLPDGGRLATAADVVIDGGVLVAPATSVVGLGGDLNSVAGGIAGAPTLEISEPDTHILAFPGTLGSVAWNAGAATTIRIVQPLSIQNALTIPAGNGVSVETELTLLSDLTISDTGAFSWTPPASLRLAGTAQQISGAAALPPLVVSGSTVILTESTTIAGVLGVTSGRLVIASTAALSAEGPIVLDSGALELQTGGSVIASGGMSGTGEVTGAVNTTLELGADSDISGLGLALDGSTLRLSGSSTVIRLPAELAIESLNASGASTSVASGSTIAVSGGSSISGALDLGTAILRPQGSLDVSGSYSGLAEVRSASTSLSGAGTFGDLTVQLSSGVQAASFSGAKLSVQGTLRLARGRLNLDAAELVFSGSNAGLELNVADELPADGTSDGTLQGGTVNSDASPFNLTWFGAVKALYLPSAELGFGPVRDLEVSVTDALNSPAVFGVQLSQDLDMVGSLTVTPGSLLRLDGGDLIATGPGVHRVDGRVAGTGYVHTSGATSVSGASIERLHVADASTSTLVDVAALERLEVRDGAARIAPSASSEVATTVIFANAAVEIAGRLDLGTSAVLTVDATDLMIDPDHSVYMGPGAFVFIDPTSEVTVGPGATSSGIQDGGFLVLTGSATLAVSPPLPRLRLAPADDATSDDVILAGNLTISESLVVVDGDFFMEQYNLTLSGPSHTFDADGVAGDGGGDAFFGDLAGPGGDLILVGPGEITLGNDIELNSANLRMRAPHGTDTVRLLSTGSPREIVVSNKQFSLESGILDLGLNDLVLSGSSQTVFQSSGGRLVGSAAPVLPAGSPEGLTDASLFPLNDDHYGELVLGAGQASVSLESSVTLDNVRLRGNLALPNNGRTLTVGKRLAVGRGGARLTAAVDQQLQIGAGAVIVQQGNGLLPRAPAFLGAYDVFYDLHDGSISGAASGFSGTLTAGPELTAGFGQVRRLGVLASEGNAVSHSGALQVTDGLAVWAGRFSFGGNLDFNAGATLVQASLGRTSPAVLNANSGYTTRGEIDVFLSSPFEDLLISNDLLPSNALIGSLQISAGSQGTVRVILNGDRPVRALSVRLADVGDILNLNGHTVTAAESIQLLGGTTTSGPFANLISRGGVLLAEDAKVTGAVALQVADAAFVEGSFLGLVLDVQSDLWVTGDLGSTLSLIFTGDSQRLVLDNGHETVSSLSMAQSAAASFPLTTLEGADLTISSAMSLSRGVFDTGLQMLTLPSASGAVQRPGNVFSHISGKVRRTLSAGTSETYVYPMGSPKEYRPITMSLSSLLTSTQLTVSYRSSWPDGLAGFPISAGGSSLLSTTPFSWHVTSSVNFAQSQPYTVSVGVPTADISDVGAARLVTQLSGTLGPWTLPSGSSAGVVAGDRMAFTAASLLGGLTPGGSTMAIGGTDPVQSDLAFVQAIHANATPGFDDVDVYLGDELGAAISYARATSAVPFRVTEPAFRGLAATGRLAGVPFAEAAASLTAANRTLLVLGPNESLATASVPPESSTSSVRPVAVHAASDLGAVTLEIASRSQVLDQGQAAIVDRVPAELTYILVRGPAGRILASHRFDFSNLGGSTVPIVATGFQSLPAGVSQNRALRIFAVLPDGSIDDGIVTTGVPPGADLPVAFRLHGNYPNPFNPTTAIRFDLPREALVQVEVFDLTGRSVARVQRGLYPAGAGQTVALDAGQLGSGVYLYRLTAGEDLATGRFVVLK